MLAFRIRCYYALEKKTHRHGSLWVQARRPRGRSVNLPLLPLPVMQYGSLTFCDLLALEYRFRSGPAGTGNGIEKTVAFGDVY